ncbi:MAG: flavodoxin family protein [Bacillota bacterium]
MLKILGIIGSKRPLGNSEVLMQEAVQGAEKEGAQGELIHLADLNLQFCRGCLACVFKGGGCAIKNDDMPEFLNKIMEADALLVAAPTYVLSPAAVIKTVCDRSLMMSPYLDELSKRKRAAATITVAGNGQWNPLGLEMLNQFALILGYPVVDYLEAYQPGPGEVLLNDSLIEAANQLGRKVVRNIQGEDAPRIPEINQCPHCYGKAFELGSDGKVTCKICLATGEISNSGSEVSIKFDTTEGHNFWSWEHRMAHQQDWIIPTRDRYLANRLLIKEKLAKYRQQ